MDLAEIADAARRGEQWAGPALVTMVCPVLAGYAATIAPGLSDADRDQAIETAIVRALGRIDRYDSGRASFTTWVRPFVRHALADMRRSRPPQAQMPDDLPTPTLDDTDPWPEDRPELVELASQLSSLSLTDQLMIQLRHGEGLSYKQIAERIGGGVNEGACRVRHHRAIQRLRENVRDHPDFAKYLEEDAP